VTENAECERDKSFDAVLGTVNFVDKIHMHLTLEDYASCTLQAETRA
jgi:hypothetical protein